MISTEVATINDLIDEVRSGELDSVEIVINRKGALNKVKISSDIPNTPNTPSPTNANTRTVNLSKPDLSHADFSNTKVQGNLSYIDLHEATFLEANLYQANIAGSNLADANFDNARISQTDFSNSYLPDMSSANMTGSVNLYGVRDSAQDIYNNSGPNMYEDRSPHHADNFAPGNSYRQGSNDPYGY